VVEHGYAFEQRVARWIEAGGLFAPAARVLVAVSGGPDSLSLLAALESLRVPTRLDLELAVAHLNHRLRGPESDRDALFVAAMARSIGIECLIGDATSELAAIQAVPPPNSWRARRNLEARAREMRYHYLQRAAHALDADAIALGHTRDDQAETVLMRIARGGGPASLAAMHPRRADRVVRPLLGESRDTTHGYLERRAWPSVHDRSNEDESLLRNAVRRRVMPVLERELGPEIGARLARLATELRVETALAEQVVDALLGGTSEAEELPVDVVERSGPAAERVVHAWLARSGVRATSRQIAAIVAIARGSLPSASIALPRGVRVCRQYGVLRLASEVAGGESGRKPGRPGEGGAVKAELAVPGSVLFADVWRLTGERRRADDPSVVGHGDSRVGWHHALDADVVGGELIVRSPVPGDRIRLAGGSRKLARVMIDARVPRAERSDFVVVASGQDILWVPGVAASVVGRLSATTRELIWLRAEREVCCEFSPMITKSRLGS
jgi:tRNA(Ile)-lysidine synthase